MPDKNKISCIQQNFNKKAISLTTYRALYIAKLLSKQDMSFDEILQAFTNDNLLSAACHKDTISNSINSLRTVGFDIEKPKPSNNFKFRLLSHPFKFKITKEHADILNLLRNSLYHQNDYKLIFDINSIYDKLIEFSESVSIVDTLETSNYLRNVDKRVLEACLELCKEKADAHITYNSPVNGKEVLKIKAEKVFFENNRLYLWLYSYKYNAPSYLRIDKIGKIQKLSGEFSNVKVTNFVEYELIGNAAKNFIPKAEEIIVASDKNKIIVKANVINKFNFFQRIISFSDECRLLYPENVKQEFLAHINMILEVY